MAAPRRPAQGKDLARASRARPPAIETKGGVWPPQIGDSVVSLSEAQRPAHRVSVKTEGLVRKYVLPALLLACFAAWAQALPAQKASRPLSAQEVQDLVENFVPSDRIIQLIRQFGISFEPSQQYLKDLREAGADEELIGALRVVQPRVPMVSVEEAETLKKTQKALQQAPLSYDQVSNLLANHIPNGAIAELVTKFGVNFQPDKDKLKGLRGSGADTALLAALQKAKVLMPTSAPQAAKQESGPKPTPRTTETTSEPAKKPPARTEEVKTAAVAGEPAVKPAVQTDRPRQPEPAVQPAPQPPEHTGPYTVGVDVDVSPPVALYQPSAPITEEARRAHIQGTVILGIVVNEHGKVTQVEEISKPLGAGLDESAIQTVRTWVFRAAQFRGLPVPVRVNVKVEFHQQY
jgi:protein TonB